MAAAESTTIEPLGNHWEASQIVQRLIKAHQANNLGEWQRILDRLRQYEPKNLDYIFRREDWGILGGEGHFSGGDLTSYGGLPIHIAASGDPDFLHEILNFVNEKYTEQERRELVNIPCPRGPGANLTPLEIAVLAAKDNPSYLRNIELLRDYGAEFEVKEGPKVKKFQPDRANARSQYKSTVSWLNNKTSSASRMTAEVRTRLLRTIKAVPKGPTPTRRMLTKMKTEKRSGPDLMNSLHDAILAKNEEEIRRIAQEIDINNIFIDHDDGWGPQNALTRAIAVANADGSANPDIIKLLLELGANPNHGFYDGEPMHTATFLESAEIIDLMEEYGGDISKINPKTNETILHYAMETENPLFIDEILQKIAKGAKVDINAVTWEGKTALTDTISRGQHNIALSLLKLGANPNVGRWAGQPMHLAVVNDFPLGELIHRGGNHKLVHPETGNSLLHVAANMNNLDLVKQLVNNGGLSGAYPNEEGVMAIDIAIEKKNREMYDFLVEKSIFDRSELPRFTPGATDEVAGKRKRKQTRGKRQRRERRRRRQTRRR